MRKVLVIISVTLGVILALEGAVRVVGLTADSSFRSAGKPAQGKLMARPNRILIIGGSLTMGVGATPGEAYPDFLQKRLDDERPGQFAVFNLGAGNANTRYILEKLDENLKYYNPTVVVAMIGERNFFNFYGFDKYLAGKDQPVPVWVRAFSLLRQSSLFRLLFFRASEEEVAQAVTNPSVMFPRFSKDDPKNLALKWIAFLYENRLPLRKLSRQQLEEAQWALESALRDSPDKKTLALLLFDVAHALGKPDETLKWLNFAAETQSKEYNYKLARIQTGYLQQVEREFGKPWGQQAKRILEKVSPVAVSHSSFEKWFENGIFPYQESEKNAEFFRKAVVADPYRLTSYFRLIQILMDQKKYDEAIQIETQALGKNPYATGIPTVVIRHGLEEKLAARQKTVLEEYAAKHAGQKSVVESLDTPEIIDWTKSDISLFCRSLRERGIPIVLQTYPPMKFDPNPTEVDSVIKSAAEAEKIPVSDTFMAMSQIFANENKSDYYFANPRDDHHLNGRGYKAVADILYSTLVKNGLLQ